MQLGDRLIRYLDVGLDTVMLIRFLPLKVLFPPQAYICSLLLKHKHLLQAISLGFKDHVHFLYVGTFLVSGRPFFRLFFWSH